MNTQSKGTVWLFKGVALGLVVIALAFLSGCGDSGPVGGTEGNPIGLFVGKVYKSQYGELFRVSATDTIELGFGDSYSTKGKVVASRQAHSGTVYLLQCSTHSNYSPAQYPGYKEGNPHSGCYLPLYVRSVTATTAEWGQFASKTGTAGEGQYGTSCFSSSVKAKAEEYLDLSRWNPQPTVSTGSAQN